MQHVHPEKNRIFFAGALNLNSTVAVFSALHTPTAISKKTEQLGW
jgi:hypothetical protein